MLLYLLSKLQRKIRLAAKLKSTVHPTSKIEPGSEFINSTIGRHSFCGYDCQIIHTEIGSFCSIANGVVIGGGMHPMNWVSTSPVFYAGRDSVRAKFAKHRRPAHRKTVIGHDVWIGQNAMIKQGVAIGNGAVIGMNSVVTRDVRPYAVVAGSPAREIRLRFTESQIRRLQETCWWNLSEHDLAIIAKDITSVEDFLAAWSRANRTT